MNMNEELEQIARDMRPWLAYAVAAAVVVALLALPGIIMAVAGWLTGGVK